MKVAWWVPRWSFASREIRSWLRSFGPKAIVRPLLISLVLSASLVVAIKAAIPDLDLHYLRWYPAALAGMYLYFALVLGLYLVLPPRVTIRAEKIAHVHGEVVWTARMEDIGHAKIIVFAPGVMRLVFRHKGRRRSIGIASWVDPHEVLRYLPGRPRLVNASGRFAHLRGGRSVVYRLLGK
jgi:hypothetical protein